MTLRDRVNELQVNDTFEKRAEKFVKEHCDEAVWKIEQAIKNNNFSIINGKKIVGGTHYYTISSFHYKVYFDTTLATPFYVDEEGYRVNNEEEAEYLASAIVARLEKEGCTCSIDIKTDLDYKQRGLLSRLFDTPSEYSYHITYSFEF